MDARALRRAFIAAKARHERLLAYHDTKWNASYIDDILAIRVAQIDPSVKKIMHENQVDALPILREYETKAKGGL